MSYESAGEKKKEVALESNWAKQYQLGKHLCSPTKGLKISEGFRGMGDMFSTSQGWILQFPQMLSRFLK